MTTKSKTWLPSGYELPKSTSKYVKLVPGANQFRIMSDPIVGWVYFDHDKKPVRVRERNEVDEDNIGEGPFGKQEAKHFWSFVVRDYQTKAISILEITQKGILDKLTEYVTTEDYSDPTLYDIKITKEGTGLETSYKLLALKEKPAPQEAIDAYENTIITLENLFHYLGDPYGPPLTDSRKMAEKKF